MRQQTVLCKEPITRIVLTSANPNLKERREMGENVKKGYLYIIPPENDRYELISYVESHENSSVIYVRLFDQKATCFCFCQEVYMAVSHRPGIYKMTRA